VSFEGDIAVVYNTEEKRLLTTVRWDGLYVVSAEEVARTSVNTVQAKRQAVTYEIWHRRLGHVPVNVIVKMVRGNLGADSIHLAKLG
jgi:hypothetical protein